MPTKTKISSKYGCSLSDERVNTILLNWHARQTAEKDPEIRGQKKEPKLRLASLLSRLSDKGLCMSACPQARQSHPHLPRYTRLYHLFVSGHTLIWSHDRGSSTHILHDDDREDTVSQTQLVRAEMEMLCVTTMRVDDRPRCC